jgi:class 3 adenylate cyclase
VIENITVLFTDLVGSTRLAAALTPDEADAVRRGHFATLRRAIAASGGTEVKNLGDGVMVVFAAASAALACAVAMQQAVARANAGADQPLGLRVGVSAGEATREAEDYFGDPVIEAARLCARADAGQVLVADLVRANAGRRSRHTFTALGPLELKGMAEPVETLELVWERADDGDRPAIPLPARMVPRPVMGLVGREEELGVLLDALKRVSTGAGTEVVLVAGEPGAGKSTLASEVARQAHEAGAVVLLGRCDEDVAAPYGPLRDALGHYVAYASDAVLAMHVAEHGGELAPVLPVLRQRVAGLPPPSTSDPDSERYLLFAAAAGLLDLASDERPVVVLVEDLHWADAPSLQLLRYLVVNARSTRLLVLGTYRDADLSIGEPLTEMVAALRRVPGASFVTLQGLGYDAVVAFMESAAGHELEGDGLTLAEAVFHETDGNPFFVSEVLRHLSETGAIVQDGAGRWAVVRPTGEVVLPESVRQVIGARVARVGSTATRVLSLASVIGCDFGIDVLAEAAGMGEDEVLDVLERARAAALVREVVAAPGRYSFSHALVQHTLYEDIGPTRRARAHRQVAEALERVGGGGDGSEMAGELARHYALAADRAVRGKAVSYARAAGEAALAALAPEDARRYFAQAIDLIGPGPADDAEVRIDLLTGLGTAQLQSGIPEFRTTLLAAARAAQSAGDNDRLVVAALANNRGFHSSLGGTDTDRVDVLEAALAATSAADSAQRARLLATLCCELTFGPLDRRVALGAEAKAMAWRLGEPVTIAAVNNLCGVPLRVPALLGAQLADAIGALALVEPLGDPVGTFWAANQVVIEATRAGEFASAARCLATMQAVAEKLRQPMLAWTALFSEAGQAMVAGDAGRSEGLAAQALEVGTGSGQPDAFANYGTQLMGVRFMQGRTGELVDLVADIAERHPSVPTYRAVLASCLLDAGDEGAARSLVREAADGGFALPMDTTWLDGVVVYARLCIELREEQAAGQLRSLLAPFDDQVPYQGLTANPPVATLLGGLATVLGDHGGAEGYLDHGASFSARGAMRFAEAYNDVLRGRMLLSRRAPGDTAQAREVLERARVAAAQRGYLLLERRAGAALSPGT